VDAAGGKFAKALAAISDEDANAHSAPAGRLFSNPASLAVKWGWVI
jgi:hypothetical protein